MKKLKGGKMLVDVILPIVDQREKVGLKELLIAMFGSIYYEVNDDLSCLEMQILVGRG
jgi:hypothetical protein